MKLFNFCDLRFQNTSLELSKGFSVAKDGEAKALVWLLNAQRTFYKVISVPKLLFLFLLVNLGVIKAPTSPIAAMVDASTKKKGAPAPAPAAETAVAAKPDEKVLPN